MGLQQNLNNIQTNLLQAKTAIAQSISHKGVECSADEALSTYATKIDSISGGSTGGTGEKFVVPNGTKFAYSTAFNPELYDTSNVTDMSDMFNNCSRLTSLDLSGWNTSKAIYMNNMFQKCSRLTSLDLSGWNTSKVTDIRAMFYECSRLTSLDLSGWNTSKVTDIRAMFYNCSALTSLDLSGWNTSKVTDISGMFYNCSALTSIDLSGFSLISCTNATDIFRFDNNLVNLNLPDLGHNQSCTSLELTACSALTKDSILYLFNNAFDRATAGYTTAFTIKLNAKTKALLSEDEIAIATNKGFTVV